LFCYYLLLSIISANSPKPVPRPDASPPVQQEVPPPPQAPAASASGPPPPPTTILEALEQRLAKYKDAADKAKEEGNGSKARRMGRITKVRNPKFKPLKRFRLRHFCMLDLRNFIKIS